MKISILGNIIDTKDIYMITPIRITGNPFENGYIFDIKIFNHDKLSIGLTIYDDLIKSISTDYNIEKRLEICKHIVDNMHKKIIEYWNSDKTDIPLIDFSIE